MSGKFDGTRSEITGPAGVEYRAVELPSGGKRTACVSMPLSPAGTNFQQLLIGRRSFTPSSAIAEYPGADVGYFFFLWSQLKGDPGAIHRLLATAVVQQCFTEPTKEDGTLVGGKLVAGKIQLAGLEHAGSSRARRSGGIDCLCTDFTNVAHLVLSSVL